MNGQRVLEILGRLGAVITDSHIVYTSWKHGTAYVNKDAVYPDTEETSFLCFGIAEQFKEDGVEVVVAPAMGGIILSQWTAHHLTLLTGRKVQGVYAEKERDERSVLAALKAQIQQAMRIPQDLPSLKLFLEARDEAGEILGRMPINIGQDDDLLHARGKERFVVRRGYDKIVAGKRVLVVEDVLTTGGSAKQVIEVTRALGGNVVGLGVLCNRGGVMPQDVADPPKLFALVNVKLDAYEEAECPLCARGVPINTEVGKGREYFARKKAV